MSEESALQPVVDFLRRHAPFAQMAPAHVDYMARRLKLVFFARGEVITEPGQGPASHLYIIKQGRVRGETPSDPEAWELVTGEAFPIGALLARRPTRTIHRAADDTFCFELAREDFDTLLNQSAVFHDFCTRRIANLLDQALRAPTAGNAEGDTDEGSLSTPVRDLLHGTPLTCSETTSLRDALEAMDRARADSIAVTDPRGAPAGLFTLHDVLARVALAERDLDDPVGAVMTTRPITLEPTAPAYRAALLMARHRFAHVCVAERGGPLLGVISERDLFSLQRVGLVGLSRAIDEADDVSALAALETDVRRFIGQMLARGAAVEQLTQLIATLNDAMTRRVIRLVLSDTGRPSVDFTWLAFGSEGRREQTLKTDQDNGILFRTPEGRTADDVRDELLPVARRINEALAEVGFPLCPGNIMAGNPECCLSLEEWQARFARWIDQGTPEHLLNATVFFDFRALDGDEAPVAALRADLRERARHNSRFRRQMAENALRNRPPLGLLRDFKVSSGGEHPHTLDLKVQGLTPFTDAARIVALAHGIDETGTMERLRAAATAGVVRDEDVAAWSEAYHFIQLLRMRTHRRQAEAGEPLDNRIDPDSLNELDRRILKEAFRQARKLQARLAVEYQL